MRFPASRNRKHEIVRAPRCSKIRFEPADLDKCETIDEICARSYGIDRFRGRTFALRSARDVDQRKRIHSIRSERNRRKDASETEHPIREGAAADDTTVGFDLRSGEKRLRRNACLGLDDQQPCYRKRTRKLESVGRSGLVNLQAMRERAQRQLAFAVPKRRTARSMLGGGERLFGNHLRVGEPAFSQHQRRELETDAFASARHRRT